MRQLALIAARLGPVVAGEATQIVALVDAVPPLLRLPLAGLAMPGVAARPRVELDATLTVLDGLALADSAVTVFEYCLTRLVGSYVRDSLDPVRRSRPGRGSAASAQAAALTLLAVVARAGNPDPRAEARAFAAGVQRLGVAARAYAPPQDFVTALDGCWAPLDALDPRFKRPLIEALVAAIADDGILAVAEAELLRTACALLHCPLPALLT